MTGGSSDALVVRTSDLARALRPWVDAYNERHPQTSQGQGRGLMYNPVSDTRLERPEVMPTGFGAVNWLSQESGVNADKISKILKANDTKHTSLRVADALLTAAGIHHALHHSVVPIPNPQWTLERWARYMREHGGC